MNHTMTVYTVIKSVYVVLISIEGVWHRSVWYRQPVSWACLLGLCEGTGGVVWQRLKA